MSSLVLELQQDALDSSVSVSDLLRKAFVVAKKLAIQEFYDWIDLELNGYTDVNKIPPYRIITGKIVSWNPYYGWIPVRNNPQIDEMLSQRAITQSIGEIDKLINNGSSFEVPFDKEIELLIMRGSNIQLKPTLKIDITQLHKILEGVRNIVLKWSLRLESDGILGRGLSFSKKEKQIASSRIHSVKNYIKIEQMVNSQIQQGTQESSQHFPVPVETFEAIKNFIVQLNQQLSKTDLKSADIQEANAEIKRIEIQLSSERPKIGIIEQSLLSIKTILEGAAGNLVASGLLQQIPSLLAMLTN